MNRRGKSLVPLRQKFSLPSQITTTAARSKFPNFRASRNEIVDCSDISNAACSHDSGLNKIGASSVSSCGAIINSCATQYSDAETVGRSLESSPVRGLLTAAFGVEVASVGESDGSRSLSPSRESIQLDFSCHSMEEKENKEA